MSDTIKTVIQFDAITGLGQYIFTIGAEQPVPAFAAVVADDLVGTPASFYKLVDGEAVERFPGGDFASKLARAEHAARIERDGQTLQVRGQDVNSLAAWQALYIERVREHANSIVGSFRKAGAAYEEETWEIQRQEYISFLKDPTNPTPYCDALAAARQLSRDALMDLVGEKLAGLATIQGTQHHIESLIETAQTVEEVQAIEVRFSL